MRDPLALAILALALGLSLLGLEKGMWLDEHSSVAVATHSDLVRALYRYDHPPAYFLLLRLWTRVYANEPFMRLLSVPFGLGTVAILMLWMRRHGRLASLLVGVLAATLPLLVRYSQEVRHYALLLFATAAAFYAAARMVDEPQRRRWHLAVAASLTLAVSTHLVAAFLFASLAAYVAMLPGAGRVRRGDAALAFAVPLAVLVVVYLALPVIRVRTPESWWMPPLTAGLVVWVAGAVSGFSHLPLPLRFVYATGAAAAAGRGDWRAASPLLLAALVFWGQLLACSALVIPLLYDRTAAPGLIPALGAAAIYSATIRPRALRRAVVVAFCLVATGFAWTWATRVAWQPVERWRELGAAIMREWQDGGVLIFAQGYCERPTRSYASVPDDAVVLPPLRQEAVTRIASTARAGRPILIVDRDDLTPSAASKRLLDAVAAAAGTPGEAARFGNLALWTFRADRGAPK